MMKTHWCFIFFKAQEVSPVYVPEVVACCAGLHNVALLNGGVVEPENEEDHDEARVGARVGIYFKYKILNP